MTETTAQPTLPAAAPGAERSVPASRPALRLALLLLLLLALWAWPFWLSLHTGTALTDDYADRAMAARMFSAEGFGDWLYAAFLGAGGFRFRPVFDLTNGLLWQFCGDHVGLIHASRWLLKLVLLALGAIPLWWLHAADRGERAEPGGRSLAGVWLFLLIVGLCWNAPESRLAPQETLMALLLVAMNLALLRTFQGHHPGRWALVSLLLYGLLLATKEPSVSFGAATLVAILPWLGRLPRRLRWGLPLGMLLLLAYASWRIGLYMSSGDAYGTAAAGSPGKLSNFLWVLLQSFHFSQFTPFGVVYAILCLLGGLIFLRRLPLRRLTRSPSRAGRLPLGTLHMVLLALQGAGFTVLMLTVPYQAARYWYPLVPIWASFAAIGYLAVQRESYRNRGSRRIPQVLLGFLSLLYIVSGYPMFLYQFDNQWGLRQVDQQLVDLVREQAYRGRQARIEDTGEPSQALILLAARFSAEAAASAAAPLPQQPPFYISQLPPRVVTGVDLETIHQPSTMPAWMLKLREHICNTDPGWSWVVDETFPPLPYDVGASPYAYGWTIGWPQGTWPPDRPRPDLQAPVFSLPGRGED